MFPQFPGFFRIEAAVELTNDCLGRERTAAAAVGDGCGALVGSGSAVWVALGVSVGRAATVASIPPLQAATANASSTEARVKGRVGALRRVSSRPSWLGKVIHTIIPRRQVSRLLVGV